jgi:hypothetical protein
MSDSYTKQTEKTLLRFLAILGEFQSIFLQKLFSSIWLYINTSCNMKLTQALV